MYANGIRVRGPEPREDRRWAVVDEFERLRAEELEPRRQSHLVESCWPYADDPSQEIADALDEIEAEMMGGEAVAA